MRRGFTLIEILVAVLVMGILAAIAGPKLARLAYRTQVETAAQQVLGDLERARSEAIKRNATVSWKKTGPASYTITHVGTRTLDGATFESGPDSIRFAPYGPVLTGGGSTFVVGSGGYTRQILVNAAGHARIP